jgi:photosystem II stability/assembly factor-like uncharacterized protein
MTITLSHGGPTIYKSSTPETDVLVGTNEGIVRMERSGSGWNTTHRTLTDLHIHAVLKEPTSGLVFAGANKGSVHISRDDGRTWSRSDNGLAETNVYSLNAVQRKNGQTRVYLGTEPARMFFSDDLGASWSVMPSFRDVPSVDKWRFPGPPHIAHLKSIDFEHGNPDTIYGSVEVGALLRSRDEGETWEELTPEYPDIHRCVIPPTNLDRLYVTGGDGIYVSSTGGSSWEHWSDRSADIGGYPDQLVYHPSNPDLMFICAAHKSPGTWHENHHSGSRIGRSRDGGRTWEVLTNGLPDRMQGSVESMCFDTYGDGGTLLVGTSIGEVWVSEDLGDSWSIAIQGLAPISKGDHYRAMEPALA